MLLASEWPRRRMASRLSGSIAAAHILARRSPARSRPPRALGSRRRGNGHTSLRRMPWTCFVRSTLAARRVEATLRATSTGVGLHGKVSICTVWQNHCEVVWQTFSGVIGNPTFRKVASGTQAFGYIVLHFESSSSANWRSSMPNVQH